MRIAVLVSGSGSNLQALLDAGDDLGAEIVLVLSDKADAYGLERARGAGIPAAVVRWADHADRAAFTTAVCDAIQGAGAEAVVLAGFMRILSAEAVERFPLRILNIHPSLLPSFPGAHAVEDSLAHGAKVTGVTVHFVDEQVDHGPVIAQRPVLIEEGDDADSLHARIQQVEHQLYPEVVAAFAAGRITVEGRTVHWEEPS
ncbi:MAG: phosphoribosylglycinamide formyltransferase [Acidimicrobiia bacterium]|nr:MAG: phosphoribosylglycinamide formyltransferase [Acidimicrobiia bacterium]